MLPENLEQAETSIQCYAREVRDYLREHRQEPYFFHGLQGVFTIFICRLDDLKRMYIALPHNVRLTSVNIVNIKKICDVISMEAVATLKSLNWTAYELKDIEPPAITRKEWVARLKHIGVEVCEFEKLLNDDAKSSEYFSILRSEIVFCGNIADRVKNIMDTKLFEDPKQQIILQDLKDRADDLCTKACQKLESNGYASPARILKIYMTVKRWEGVVQLPQPA